MSIRVATVASIIIANDSVQSFSGCHVENTVVKLEGPSNGGGTICSQFQDPDSGLAVRYLRMFDGRESKWINRIDCALGFGDFYVDGCIGILSA